jgi:hypothetical protein
MQNSTSAPKYNPTSGLRQALASHTGSLLEADTILNIVEAYLPEGSELKRHFRALVGLRDAFGNITNDFACEGSGLVYDPTTMSPIEAMPPARIGAMCPHCAKLIPLDIIGHNNNNTYKFPPHSPVPPSPPSPPSPSTSPGPTS